MIAVATYLAMRWLEVPPRADRYIQIAILVVVWWQVGRWLSAAVRHLIETRRGHDVAGAEGRREPQHPALRRRAAGVGRSRS